MKCSRMLALTVSLLAACGFAGPNLLTNGTFDEGTVTQNSGSWSYMTGEGFVNPGWTCTGGIGLSVGNNTWVNGALAVRKYTLYCQKAGTFEQTFNVEETDRHVPAFVRIRRAGGLWNTVRLRDDDLPRAWCCDECRRHDPPCWKRRLRPLPGDDED